MKVSGKDQIEKKGVVKLNHTYSAAAAVAN